MNPKVSIIIPVYNGSNYLKEAIESAIAQTYNNIEIVVVNDGSNDDGATELIAESYGDKIRYYAKENGGVATALNLGIKKMKGEYFSWLSHDDLYYPEKIEKQIAYLDKLKNKKVVLYSNYSILVGDQITPVVHNHEMLVRKKKYSLLRGCVNGITMLIPKIILDETGQFSQELRCTQDYDYWRRVQKTYEFIHMEDVLSITRLHSHQDSLSPAAKTEGNKLWIDMVDGLTEDEKLDYEGTLYNFYLEMVKFLKTAPYDGTLQYCEEKMVEAEKELKLYDINFKISVIIPFFNRVDITTKAIKSVLSQTYKNIEIILVNDASTDDIEQIRQFAKKHDQIKLIDAAKNGGPAVARNIGIKAATGDYIAFLDSDDLFLPNKLEYQMQMMLRYNPKVSYTSYIKRVGDDESVICDKGLTGLVIPRIISNCTIATPTVVIRRDILTNNNILFDENIRIGEDTCFWLEIAKYSEILLVDEPLTIVNAGKDSNAYHDDKIVVGLKNIIVYLLNDEYYSNYYYDVSLLCKYFNILNDDIRARKTHTSPTVSCVEVVRVPVTTGFIRNSLPYRVARKLYREGPKAVVVTVVSKVIKR